MLWPVTKALLGHYRRYPFQILLVWLGLTLGVSLLVGVTSINKHAQMSYEHGEKLFSNPLPYRIRPKHVVAKIPQGFYIHLRQQGFNQCAPIDSIRVPVVGGLDVQLVGIDPVAMMQIESEQVIADYRSLSLMRPPHPVLISRDLAYHLKLKDNDKLVLQNGREIGPVIVDRYGQTHGTRAIIDLSTFRRLERSAGVSVIACGEMSQSEIDRLEHILPNGMVLTRSSKAELEGLTQAFHTNLTAMGMLAFVVGLFIFYQAMSLSMIQRQPMVGILRQTGVSAWMLAAGLSIELFVLVFVSWLCGNTFGLILANQLIPKVSASLADLYGANVGLAVEWSWQAGFYSFAMCLFASALACTWPLIRLLRSKPIRLTPRLSLMRFAGREFFLQAMLACVLCVSAIAIYQAPHTQESGFTIITLLLLSTALITPYVIWKVFQSFSYSLKWIKARWFFADAAASMSYRGVATMAFMLAMAANIGVETMVGSFRDTTDKWLNQRLAADLYIYPNNDHASTLSRWLVQQPEVESIWWRWETILSSDSGKVEVVSTGPSQTESSALPVKLAIPNYWHYLHEGKGLMISESMALKRGIRTGDIIDLPGAMGSGWQVVGVYYDYGNPYHQILVSHRNWLYAFAGSGNVALGTMLKNNADATLIKRKLRTLFGLSDERIFNNNEIHGQAMKLFDRTFSIANTLGHITLVIAVFGIFFATLAGELSRQRHSMLLRCLGVSGKEMIVTSLLQLLVFGVVALLIAMPLGIMLAQLVVDIIIKNSFGWTLEVKFLPIEYLKTALLALGSLVLAGAIPVVRMARHRPMKLLRDAL